MLSKKTYVVMGAFIFIFVMSVFYSFFLQKDHNPTPVPQPTGSNVSAGELQRIGTVAVDDMKSALSKDNIGIKATRVFGDYAIVTTYSKDGTADNANVILKKTGDKWDIIAGPGTDFDPEELKALGLPQEAVIGANNFH